MRRVRFAAPVTLEAEERWAEPCVGWRRAAPPSADRGELPRQAAAQSGNSNRTQQHTRSHTDTHTHARTLTDASLFFKVSAVGSAQGKHTHTPPLNKGNVLFLFIYLFLNNGDNISCRDADECEHASP